jgi:hypothetical protein
MSNSIIIKFIPTAVLQKRLFFTFVARPPRQTSECKLHQSAMALGCALTYCLNIIFFRKTGGANLNHAVKPSVCQPSKGMRADARLKNCCAADPPRYRHIVTNDNHHLPCEFPAILEFAANFVFRSDFLRTFNLGAADAALHQNQLRHNCQLLQKGTALYGCRGTRLKRQLRAIGTPGHQ